VLVKFEAASTRRDGLDLLSSALWGIKFRGYIWLKSMRCISVRAATA